MNRRVVAVAPALLLASVIVGGCGSSRTALSADRQAQVSAAVQRGLSQLAASPRSGISRGIEVILSPMCVSITDPRYVAVVAYPIVDHGQIGQAAFVYTLRDGSSYRMLDAFQVGSVQVARPGVVPERAWNGIGVGRSCLPTAPDRLLALRKAHSVPDFTIQ